MNLWRSVNQIFNQNSGSKAPIEYWHRDNNILGKPFLIFFYTSLRKIPGLDDRLSIIAPRGLVC